MERALTLLIAFAFGFHVDQLFQLHFGLFYQLRKLTSSVSYVHLQCFVVFEKALLDSLLLKSFQFAHYTPNS